MSKSKLTLPTVVRIRRQGGEIVQDCDVYIGRRLTMGGWALSESIWHNPYPVKEHGRKKALLLYVDHVYKSDKLCKELKKLSGKSLGCWCTNCDDLDDKIICHGQVLMHIFNELYLTEPIYKG